jgi:hypothetical protein
MPDTQTVKLKLLLPPPTVMTEDDNDKDFKSTKSLRRRR